MRRLLLPAASLCTAVGAWTYHRLGAEWRHFIRDLATDVALRPHTAKPPRRHP